MAQMTGRTMRGLDRIDQFLYSATVPRVEQFQAFANRGFGGALSYGLRRGGKHLMTGAAEVTGLGYLHGATRHYYRSGIGRFNPPTASMNPAWDKYFETLHPRLKMSATKRFGYTAGRTARSAAGVVMRGLVPGLIVHQAAQDEMGFGVGLAKEAAGFAAWGTGMSIGLQMGGWAGATTGTAAGGGIGWALGKIPGVKKKAAVALGRTLGKTAGAFVGGPIGLLVGGLALYEAASWGVGMALHTLPTFAKQFRADMSASGFGGDYEDSAGAITMRQRGLQAMGRSHVNARSALGQEASLMHV